MARLSVGFNVDTSQGNALAGFLQQVSTTVGTAAHMGPVIKYAHSVLADDFVIHMSKEATNYPSLFHHVYEWNQVGNPSARLWKDVLKGGGGTRTATFEWRASKTIVPVREDFAEGGVKPIHIFVWKAPVMEYSTDITISPKRGKQLAFYTGPTNPEDKYAMRFAKRGESITVTDPGGPLVKGAFTKEYVAWWAGTGMHNSFKTKINMVLQANMHAMVTTGISSLPIGTRSRKKTFGLITNADSTAAIAAGKAAANAVLNKQDHRYIELAKRRIGNG